MKIRISLFVILFILIFAYIFSFFNFNEKKYNKYFETVFLNNKYENKIDEISIKNNNTEFLLIKRNNVWVGKNIYYEFPVDQKLVENSLEKLKKIRKMYKISDNIKDYSSFSLDSSSCVEISCKSDKNILSKFYVGKLDFSNSKRFILIDKSTCVFKTDADFEDLLQLDYKHLSDPYIIPRNLYVSFENEIQKISISSKLKTISLVNNTSIDNYNDKLYKLMELRHGELCFIENIYNSELFINVEYSNGNILSIKFYPNESGNYLVLYDDNKFWKYSVSISNWTFRRILDVCGLN